MNKLMSRTILMFVLWIMLTASLAVDELITGFIVSIITAWISLELSPVDKNDTPISLKGWFLFIPTLFIEIIKANIDITKIVLSPKIDINPGFVTIPTKLNSNTKRWFLANAITLTPGTVTVDILDDETLLVHWIHIEGETPDKQGDIIKETFEKALA